MALSDTLATVLSGTSIASILGAVAVVIRTRQQRRVSESDVVRRLSGTVGDLAEDVRRDARETIEDIRRSAERQIEWAGRRAEDAERRAVSAERSAPSGRRPRRRSTPCSRPLPSGVSRPRY